MFVDFGDVVKSNQVLATLEVPELQDQLRNAIAAEQKAEADYRATHTNYVRLLTVGTEHPNLVAQADLDTAQGKDGMAEAAVAAARAEVGRFFTLTSYTNITAPWDGVITHRYVDEGALIQMGTTSATQSLAVVRISDNYHLRMDFWPSVQYVKDIHLSDTVQVQVGSLGNKLFEGHIKRVSLQVNKETRTMLTEIELFNPTLEIVPGMYAKVLLQLQPRPHSLAIPHQAVAGQPPTVYLIGPDRKIQERPVTLGLETPDRWEVTSGLREGDLVVFGSRSRVQPGQLVTPKVVEPPSL
jgi:RND family efflux transporter MFP subunit